MNNNPQILRGTFIKVFLAGVLLIFTITACGIVPVQPTVQPATQTPVVNTETPKETLITFTVTVPANTPESDPILISILDEVTGLALNAKRYSMEKTGPRQYTIQLPFEIGTIVKYRYSRKGNILSEEHTFEGDPVRYRLAWITAPAEIHDIVTRWTDTQYKGKTGRISGTITREPDSEPLPGLLVSAGGAQTYTNANGSFALQGLPPGTHNLVIYAIDGSFQPHQQGALVAEDSNTPVNVSLQPAVFVDVAFIVKVPPDMIPAVPLRLAGNLFQLGNTFSDLAGGINGLATRMPVLSPLPDGRYGIILSLPSGTDIHYKYTLGDGFWNSEQQQGDHFIVRSFIVPPTSTVIEDEIASFNTSGLKPITFDITVPEDTPADEKIFIQFNPYGWTEPLPMWKVGDRRWVYILTSPLQTVQKVGVRYCRQGQCNHADDLRTVGDYSSGKVVKPGNQPIIIQDQIEKWAWLEGNSKYTIPGEPQVRKRHDFIQAVEFQPGYKPDWGPLMPSSLAHLASLGVNTVIFTPRWSFVENNPPVLLPASGNSMHWMELTAFIQQTQSSGMSAAIKPTPQFPTNPEDWWVKAPRTFSWWVSWFDQYETFILHYAKLAEIYQVKMLVIGGEWLAPALPHGKLADGSNSQVPLDANDRWEKIIEQIRKVYSGKIIWDLPYPDGIEKPPYFINKVDQLYLSFDARLAKNNHPELERVTEKAAFILEKKVHPFWLSWTPKVNPTAGKNSAESIGTKPALILAVSFPSVDGGISGCPEDPVSQCFDIRNLEYPAPDYPSVKIDLKEQADAYQAVLSAANQYNWIGGFVSRGYYPPAVLLDKSTSVHGKPAESVLDFWFHHINP